MRNGDGWISVTAPRPLPKRNSTARIGAGTRPGQWYLDRVAGRVVYWPLPGEDMSKAKVIAPRLERLIRIAGSKRRPAEKITIRDLVLQATNTPLKAGGTVRSVTDGGAPFAAADLLGKGVRFIAKPYGKAMGGWRGQWVIPLDALGLKAKTGVKVAFNLSVFRSEDEVWRCWEGTRAETWRLDQAGQMQFK